jgi:DNA processing protein
MEEIKQVKIEDADYPELLKQISGAPKVLWYRGILPSPIEICVAVVGTRRPSPYGQQATLQLAGDLANAGVTIVSGMAPGIDTFAHKICVEKGRRTIAVLGTGLDEKSIYPQTNLVLSREIIKHGGCLISELSPHEHGSKFTFPRRNRIISGLSLGVVVIEAKEKSGSLITADYARKQQKKIFAVPGPIFVLNSAGPNKLIKKGATLVESAEDILDVLGIESASAKASADFDAATPQEVAILTALKEGSLYIDAIIATTKLNASSVATTLALMEISGKIRNLGGNTYSLN